MPFQWLQDGLILLDLWVLPSDLEEDHPTVRRLGRFGFGGCVQRFSLVLLIISGAGMITIQVGILLTNR